MAGTTEAGTMTLTEFLLERIAEDEAVARENLAEWGDSAEWQPGDDWSLGSDDEYPGVRVEAGRVLAECEAKRRIVALHQSWPTLIETPLETETTNDIESYVLRASKQIAWLTTSEYVARFGSEPPTSPILSLLALPYMHHKDYDEDW
jgi:hypothetical protein